MRARFKTSPRRVGSLLTAAVPALEERLTEHRIHLQWSDTVGPEIGRRARPGKLERGVLEVRVDNSPWLADLTLRQEELLAAIVRRFPRVVRGVRLGLGRAPIEAPRVAEPARAPANVPPPVLPAEERAEIDELAGAVADPAAADALRRLMEKDRLTRRHGTPPVKGAPR